MIISLEQNTFEWIEFRKQKIGSSDSPAILGVSPFSTPLKLWQQKRGEAPSTPDNPSMRRGRELESQARELCNVEFSCSQENYFKTIVMQSDMDEFMISSLDGYLVSAHHGPMFIEIKCPSLKSHLAAIEHEEIPHHYMIQCQHHFFVSECARGFYVSYNPEHEKQPLCIVEIERDVQLITEIREACLKFYRSLKTGEMPEATNKDFIDMSTDDSLVSWCDSFNSMKSHIEACEAELAEIKQQIIVEMQLKGLLAAKVNDRKIQYQTRKGNVDYSKIEALENLNLDPYRKPSTQSWVIR